MDYFWIKTLRIMNIWCWFIVKKIFFLKKKVQWLKKGDKVYLIKLNYSCKTKRHEKLSIIDFIKIQLQKKNQKIIIIIIIYSCVGIYYKCIFCNNYVNCIHIHYILDCGYSNFSKWLNSYKLMFCNTSFSYIALSVRSHNLQFNLVVELALNEKKFYNIKKK